MLDMNPADKTRAILTHPDCHAAVLAAWTIDRLGGPALNWHPGALRAEVARELGARLPPANFDRLMAAVCILTTDRFFRDASTFAELVNVLAGAPAGAPFEPPDAVECAWAVTEGLLLSPPAPDEADHYFSDDVRTFLGVVLREEGFVSPPDVLRIALGADFSDRVRYDFEDDPEMFSAAFRGQQSKAAEVDKAVRGGLRDLMTQLRALPLGAGNTADLETRIRAELSAPTTTEAT